MPTSKWRMTRGSSARSRCIPIGAPSSGCCTTRWNRATGSASSPIPTATRDGTARAIPGASLFGAYGGLSCLLAPELTRAGLFDALRRRHHYATTGCRLVLDVRAAFDAEAEKFADDPQLGPTTSTPARTAMMGDILRSDEGSVEFTVEALGSAPIERIEIRNGLDVLETWRPYRRGRARAAHPGDLGGFGISRARPPDDLGRRLHADGNAFERIAPINLWNLDKKLRQTGPGDAGLGSADDRRLRRVRRLAGRPRSGTLRIDTPLVKCEIAVADIGLEDLAFEAGGIGRRIRVFRLPDDNPHRRLRSVAPHPAQDRAATTPSMCA